MYVCIYIFVERERDPNNSQHIAWTDLESRSIWCTRYGGTREWPTSNKPFSGNFGQVIPRHTFLIVFSIYNSLFLYVFLDVYIYIYYKIILLWYMFHQISSYFPYVSSNFIIFPMISLCFPFFHFFSRNMSRSKMSSPPGSVVPGRPFTARLRFPTPPPGGRFPAFHPAAHAGTAASDLQEAVGRWVVKWNKHS